MRDSRRTRHPLEEALLAAHDGNFVTTEQPVQVVPPPPTLLGAIVAFSGCTFIAADVDPVDVRNRLGGNPLVGPVLPAFAEWLALQVGGQAQNHEVVLVATGTGGRSAELEPDPDWMSHDRAQHGARLRSDITGWKHQHGIVLVGRGLLSRWEVGYEVSADAPPGAGRALARAALRVVPTGEPVFAQIAPGHARSLRAALAAGYTPIGGETLITPA